MRVFQARCRLVVGCSWQGFQFSDFGFPVLRYRLFSESAFPRQKEKFAQGSVLPTPAPPVLPEIMELFGAETITPTLFCAART